ncbi:hypothetical protein FISHEDRAFT_54891 [Fistulina hepatica ATCC 64428]|uniref:MYND-type domain-containing protein n=1 Tax=Fistulina hepatica ATCC 64428 TaxID=1128425 RepID=A0A0D7AQ89_9AGAR|nr:hypothetical protein FISHEDRAFT_54891 [Fistulina hepatica ATCC 64428]
MVRSLVAQFNGLPRTPTIPSPGGKVDNVWYFDIRYDFLEPNPSHVLFLVQPKSQSTHLERLPLRIDSTTNSVHFFPESAEDAAPVVTEALLHSFVHNLGRGSNASSLGAPWRLMTEESALAAVVGKALKKIGVGAEDLWDVSVSSQDVAHGVVDDLFQRKWEALKRKAGYVDRAISALVPLPNAISFSSFSFRPPAVPGSDSEAALTCARHMCNAQPQLVLYSEKNESDYMQQNFGQRLTQLNRNPFRAVKAKADAGDLEAAFDCGIRYFSGYQCTISRKKARHYLMKPIDSPNTSPQLRSASHSALLQWFTEASTTDKIRSRYLYMALHHAEQAIFEGSKVAAPGVPPASPYVCLFLQNCSKALAEACPALGMFYPMIKAELDRSEESKVETSAKLAEKSEKHPNRYRCANEGCPIMANHGRMLRRCSGKCDVDKKPHYCSKDCQKADWKRHKPFCRPGAPASFEVAVPNIGFASKGALQIPVKRADGTMGSFSTTSLDPTTLRELKELLDKGDTKLPSHMSGIELRHVDIDI